MEEREQAITKAFSLYPRQVSIIEQLAQADNRTLSNALQQIITEWAKTRQNGDQEPQPEGKTA